MLLLVVGHVAGSWRGSGIVPLVSEERRLSPLPSRTSSQVTIRRFGAITLFWSYPPKFIFIFILESTKTASVKRRSENNRESLSNQPTDGSSEAPCSPILSGTLAHREEARKLPDQEERKDQFIEGEKTTTCTGTSGGDMNSPPASCPTAEVPEDPLGEADQTATDLEVTMNSGV